MTTSSAVQAYIDSVQPFRLQAQGLVKDVTINLSDLVRTLYQAVEDLIAVVAPDDANRRTIVLNAVGQVYDKLSPYLPTQYRALYLLLKPSCVALAGLLYDWLTNKPDAPVVPVTPDSPSKPSEPTVIHVDPNTGLPAKLAAQQALAAQIEGVK